MNDPETPTDEQLTVLMAATDKDALPPDPAFLARLREQSQTAFEATTTTSTSATTPAPNPTSPRKRTMHPIPFRWLAASVAALVVLGLGVAYWAGAFKPPVSEPPPGDEQFVIAETLVDDGRIGNVTDSQGVVAVKPVMNERWSPVLPRLVLKPGDWLRTDARGANAIAVKLLKAALIVGPHSTVELVKADEIRLLAGEIEINATENAPVELHGPDKQQLTIKGKQQFRVEKEKLVRVEKEPLWLQGFKGTTANESLGSLVATVDGRNVPLTVGYHHVTVEIRDQIARTTIEESFVNNTPNVLEGVFYFPLPQDASISGFGMWIGDTLVEADVVEKQRAREIYETILREKRDPGLLEWAGGNIFKARVYPIPGRSEKRIKITYTQVLPLQGNRYRYSYGLQSELLKQHPLRDLKIDVRVNSAVPLKAVSSPTHPARVAKTEHSGHVEFSAQEYTPTRDFEAVVEVEAGRPDVVVIPHRRGEDGYFMVQLTPPGAAGDWERPLVPNGDPLKLLFLADTSASMDVNQRAAQTAVLTSLLGSLTSKDVINLAACDVNCDWVFEKPVPATPANVATVLDFLAKRSSLGWTDLDKAFTSAMAVSTAGTHVVYLGDGISTTGTADPVAFAKRLQKLYEGKAGVFHAIAMGTSYEPGALKAIASLGSGSVRRVSGDRGPQATALDLLTEITTPGLRDLKVEFVGVRTARVYPETLPNVPAGMQQILLGRYLPEGKDQSGEIVVTGTLGGKSVRYSSKIALKDAEQGNSFVPRLWARLHLDKLLEQGRTETVKQDVIALSEEFNIITPYTSLLVLESDADRERFAVKRRFQMRDGEKFFATGRDNANFDLKQKQMRLAGEYRTLLRRQVIAQLNTLGRDARLFNGPRRYEERTKFRASVRDWDGEEYYLGDISGERDEKELLALGLSDGSSNTLRFETLDRLEKQLKLMEDSPPDELWKSAGRVSETTGIADPLEKTGKDGLHGLADDFGLDDLTDLRALRRNRDDEYAYATVIDPPELSRIPYSRGRPRGPRMVWLGSLFPSIAAPAREPKLPKSKWPAPALALSQSLLRTDKLAQIKGGVIITRQTDSFDTRTAELYARSQRLELVSPTAWLGRSTPNAGPITVNWCDAKEYGVYSTAFQLGRVRHSNLLDLRNLPLELADSSVSPLHLAYATYVPTVEAIAKDRELLILKYKDDGDYETRYLIDTNRHVILSIEHRTKGKVTGTTKFSDFVEVGGTWWAKRVETFDEKDRRITHVTQTVSELPVAAFDKRMAQELVGKGKVLFLRHALPTVTEAKAAVAAGKATFDDHAVLTMYFGATQQWSLAFKHLEECERLAGAKVGMRWLRDSFLFASRRYEELRKRLLAEGTALAATTDADTRANDYVLAEYLTGQAQSVLETNESFSLSDTLQKVYQRQPAHLDAVKTWRNRRVSLFDNAGQPDKALQTAKDLATDYPRDHSLQYHYVQLLARSGDFPAAYTWIDRALAADTKWSPYQEDSLREQYAGFLQQQSRHRDLVEYLAAWLKRNPESSQPYAKYLAALVWTNQAARAELLVAQWLREAQIEDELPQPVASRLYAAVSFAVGNGYNLYSNRVEERWQAPLAEAAQFFARRDVHADHASNILHSRFTYTDAGRAARKALAAILLKEIDTFPLLRIDHFLRWVGSGGDLEPDEWRKVLVSLRKRWDAEKTPDGKHRIAQTLHRALSWLGSEETLAFLRVQYATSAPEYRTAYATELFNAFLSRPWTGENEDEAISLLDKLADTEDLAGGLFTRVAALHRLTDSMLQARFQARVNLIEHPEKLPRTELQKKYEEARKLAREGFSDRLRKETPKHAKRFAAWIVAERIWIDVQLERDLKTVTEECWAHLSIAPIKAKPDDDGSEVEAKFEELLRARFFLTLENLAARKGADAGLVDRLLKYVDQQLKEYPEDTRWRAEKYHLLVALDRDKELEVELGKWIAGSDLGHRWRLALGYLLAEQGKLPEAIKQFEVVEAGDELTPAAHRTLAEWYLVENRRAESEKARAAAYKTTDESQLSYRLQQYLSPWQSTTGHLPTTLDPEVLQIFTILFEKSTTPQSYLSLLQQFYQASHDFRLLSMLPDGVIGHTAGKVYPFLRGMLPVIGEIRNEAVVDEIVKRIAEVRKTAKTAVDQRALDLLELMVERRASELQNQPGPHAEKALAALERAFKHEWSPGESRLMAAFLAALGNIPQAATAKEQLRQLEVLHRDTLAGSFDRLHVAYQRAETLAGYSRRPEATDLLAASLREFEEANNGVLPTSANNALTLLISFNELAEHYASGEKLLLNQLKHPIHAEQKNWLIQRLNELYIRAMQNKGEVSLGTGLPLYKALERKLLADLVGADQTHRQQLLSQLTRIYASAHVLKFTGVADDLKTFAFKLLPPILKEQTSNYESIVRDVADTLHQVIGPREAIAFVLDRLDDEPDWLRYTNQDAWNRHAYHLAGWRTKVKDLGDLEPRLLKFVLAELRRDISTHQSRSRYLYDRREGYFWTEKEADFAKVAEEVVAERKTSSSTVEHVANYLFFGLAREKRAIEILFAAHEQKVLAVSGQAQLIDYLHRTKRFAESIPLLLPLVEKYPANIGYAVQLMHAYFRTEKQGELLALLKKTDSFFHEKDRWGEGPLAALADSCLENRLFSQSVTYCEELIPLRQKLGGRHGNGDSVLSHYYSSAARAYAGLGKTKQAVDMASGAVVTWGPNHEQRKNALKLLVDLLVEAPNLAAYVAELDKEKLQSAIVRKAIGQAYIEKNEHARAVPQLQLASELQPDDPEIYAALLTCFDKTGDKDSAIRELLRAVELSRRDIKLFEQLGNRYVALNQVSEGERAFTSIVEMLPNESESHALLAEVREKQKRWPEAIAHWERVAEIRALEPTGLLKLAGAQIENKDWAGAAKTLHKLRSQNWPPRFTDVQKEIRTLEKTMEERSKR